MRFKRIVKIVALLSMDISKRDNIFASLKQRDTIIWPVYLKRSSSIYLPVNQTNLSPIRFN